MNENPAIVLNVSYMLNQLHVTSMTRFKIRLANFLKGFYNHLSVLGYQIVCRFLKKYSENAALLKIYTIIEWNSCIAISIQNFYTLQ